MVEAWTQELSTWWAFNVSQRPINDMTVSVKSKIIKTSKPTSRPYRLIQNQPVRRPRPFWTFFPKEPLHKISIFGLSHFSDPLLYRTEQLHSAAMLTRITTCMIHAAVAWPVGHRLQCSWGGIRTTIRAMSERQPTTSLLDWLKDRDVLSLSGPKRRRKIMFAYSTWYSTSDQLQLPQPKNHCAR